MIEHRARSDPKVLKGPVLSPVEPLQAFDWTTVYRQRILRSILYPVCLVVPTMFRGVKKHISLVRSAESLLASNCCCLRAGLLGLLICCCHHRAHSTCPHRGGKAHKGIMGDSITLQRRSSKVDIQLSSFQTFALFEKHVESKFDLEEGVREKICLCWSVWV